MEQIYTIPINEAFESCRGKAACPFCEIRAKFERDEVDLILGASMMEPDVRIKTNEFGFCRRHFSKMQQAGKKLPVALILESHLGEISDKMKGGRLLPAVSAKGSAEKLGKVSDSCYVCSRLDSNFEKVLSNAVYMWGQDEKFRRMTREITMYCLPHYSAFLRAASRGLKGADFRSFSSSIRGVEQKYLDHLEENVSFFVKKFDYRYENEPWGDAKDAVERAIAFLSGTSDD